MRTIRNDYRVFAEGDEAGRKFTLEHVELADNSDDKNLDGIKMPPTATLRGRIVCRIDGLKLLYKRIGEAIKEGAAEVDGVKQLKVHKRAPESEPKDKLAVGMENVEASNILEAAAKRAVASPSDKPKEPPRLLPPTKRGKRRGVRVPDKMQPTPLPEEKHESESPEA